MTSQGILVILSHAIVLKKRLCTEKCPVEAFGCTGKDLEGRIEAQIWIILLEHDLLMYLGYFVSGYCTQLRLLVI